MSGKDSEGAPLFGYMFDHSQAGPSDLAYPPPSHQPLLRDHESDFLSSFFNDPNNIDPTALSSMPTEFQGDSANAFGNTNFDWLNQQPNQYDNSNTMPQKYEPEPQDWQGQSLGVQPIAESSRPMQPTADVYQAAGILHNNNAANSNNNNNNPARHQAGNAYTDMPFPPQQPGNDSNGYTYPPLSNSNNASYYNSPTTSQNPYNGFQGRYQQAEEPSPYGPAFNNGVAGAGPRGQTLNFGSDDDFRNSIYAASRGDGPDKSLAEAISHNFANSPHPGIRNPAAPVANMRKRPRQSGPADSGDIPEAGFNGDEAAMRKRRKSKAKDEDDDEEDDYDGGSAKKGKRRPAAVRAASSVVSPQGAGTSPAGRTTPRSADPRPPRENLSEEQKRNNHIQSEQKRRNLIKNGFDDLTRMVPELRSGSLSKSNMLMEAAKFIRRMRDDNNALEELVGPIDKG